MLIKYFLKIEAKHIWKKTIYFNYKSGCKG